MEVELRLGDCLDVMAEMPENSVDSVICDPPYGLSFMGKDWDDLGRKRALRGATSGLPSGPGTGRGTNPVAGRPAYDLSPSAQMAMQEWHYRWACEALRVAKSGAMLMAFGGTRTFHRLACAIEDAGWILRDTLMWVYAQGFPKSHDISKAIDKAAGAEREIVGEKRAGIHRNGRTDAEGGIFIGGPPEDLKRVNITAPATPAARAWNGWGTALKPAWEPIILAMKPLDGTFAQNAQKWGVAGLNIDGCRVPTDGRPKREVHALRGDIEYHPSSLAGRVDGSLGSSKAVGTTTVGRWPANLVHDGSDEVVGLFPDSACCQPHRLKSAPDAKYDGWGKSIHKRDRMVGYSGIGSAARFFYCAKASRRERTCGGTVECNHPTIKPLALMEYLCKLTRTPTGGVVLDPFMGSGTTGLACINMGRDFVGIEIDEDYFAIAEARIRHAQEQPAQLEMPV
jgi:site-specific DNA-methyltransferase (adenine-specific)